MKNAKIYIYALLNPITNQYFYVGMTSQDLTKRLNCHMNSMDKNEQKVAVIQGILNYGERPQIVELQTTYDMINCSNLELAWMNKLKFEGHPLTNKSYNKQGCKPAKNPKRQISLYVTNDIIEKFGGVNAFKEKVHEIIDNYIPPKEVSKEMFND